MWVCTISSGRVSQKRYVARLVMNCGLSLPKLCSQPANSIQRTASRIAAASSIGRGNVDTSPRIQIKHRVKLLSFARTVTADGARRPQCRECLPEATGRFAPDTRLQQQDGDGRGR